MKLNKFDFRIWDCESRKYVNETYQKYYHCVGIVKWFENFIGETQDFSKNEFFGFQFFNRDKDDGGGFNTTENVEIELWCGICDKEESKIYVGDIVLLEKSKTKEIFEIMDNITYDLTSIIFMHHKYDDESKSIVHIPYTFNEIVDKYKIYTDCKYINREKNGSIYKNLKIIGNIHEKK